MIRHAWNTPDCFGEGRRHGSACSGIGTIPGILTPNDLP
ncbi:MAG: hypothetical protein JWO08_1293 [Verrucomicrobiaceae bacterium]|nr:hypothetical protein [Verrucomicrobiaceae bacterium]